jgi:two-component system response regulator FixJ
MMVHTNIVPAKHAVLVVDDDPAVRSSLDFCLSIDGYEVRTYASGADLLAERDFPAVGCLIINYVLPDINGLELLAELRRRKVSLPAILITSNPSALLRARTTKAGAIMIEKPLLNESLFEGIRATQA